MVKKNLQSFVITISVIGILSLLVLTILLHWVTGLDFSWNILKSPLLIIGTTIVLFILIIVISGSEKVK